MGGDGGWWWLETVCVSGEVSSSEMAADIEETLLMMMRW